MIDVVEPFIARWEPAKNAERGNAQLFLGELCDLLGVPRPDPAQGGGGPYRFERGVVHYDPHDRATQRRIDLYRRGCFILEAKQGGNAARQQTLFAGQSEATQRQLVRNSPGWFEHMARAKGQAEGYVRDLPASEPAPPFLIVCDVGFCFDLYADFSGTGRHYAQFPDAQGFRLYLPDLRDAALRARLVAVWNDPASLDPALRRTVVTREIAAYLAELAKSLEKRHPPEAVALFLIRCIFCMFAQSMGLLLDGSFTVLLERFKARPAGFVPMLSDLWRQMDTGGYSIAINERVRRFNGGLFASGRAGGEPLEVTADELHLLVMAAGRDWANVEPAIFGTLLETALSSRDRSRLGAHFTPRAFVERLVLPTVMEPLRWEWDSYKVASAKRLEAGDGAGAAAELRAFHTRLCAVRVLDPACGTGNFLYVTMELMKQLEGEVLDALANVQAGEGAGFAMPDVSVDPAQFLGLEKNARAVPVAELVLWIGYLQWHARTRGTAAPAEPILHDYRTIREVDALLTFTDSALLRDKQGVPITRWDGRTHKRHPITGEEVPDERAREEVTQPINPRMTKWPEADFIVGNPPFIAGKDMRAEQGEGYAQALWDVYRYVPDSADIALFFWWRAAELLRANKTRLRRFGFITSNSLRQVFCRRVVADAMGGKRRLHLVYAIPDHPWADGKGTAAVRIAMTVAERAGRGAEDVGRLERVVGEGAPVDGVPQVTLASTTGVINADLTIGADPDQAEALLSNEGLCSRGVPLHGAGFILTPAQHLGLRGEVLSNARSVIRPYVNGRDLMQRPRGLFAIDAFGLSEAEVRIKHPAIYQHLMMHVKPKRDLNRRDSRRTKWWLFGENMLDLRKAVSGLPRYIATAETAKHRVFCFLPEAVLPDNMLVCIATDDAFHLGVLSSRIHIAWALAAGGRLGVGNDPRYNKTRCFDPFPFPDATAAQRAAVGSVAEEIDGMRRAALDAHPALTMTGLYNVLEALRCGRTLSTLEHDIHDQGHVSILHHLHDRLDAAVAEAYGWPHGLEAAAIVARVVALNIVRRADEQAGTVAWLRPEFQAPKVQRGAQGRIAMVEGVGGALPAWPARVQEQVLMLRGSLAAAAGNPAEIARRFSRATPKTVEGMLERLVSFGQARRGADGAYRL